MILIMCFAIVSTLVRYAIEQSRASAHFQRADEPDELS